jgi:serpin B
MPQMIRISIVQLGLLAAVLSPALLSAQLQDPPPGSALSALVQGNERLGRKLLAEAHRAHPEKNIVLAPLPVTVMLAAIQNSSDLENTQEEIGGLFGWGAYPTSTGTASRMLLAAFQKPTEKELAVQRKLFNGVNDPPGTSSPWITNSILYKPDKNGRSPFSAGFLAYGPDYYGIDFRPVTDVSPLLEAAGLPPDSKATVFFSSHMHVHMAWLLNTFSISEPFKADFRPVTGEAKAVEMQTSELSNYPYAKTALCEAAVLPCFGGNMTVVLPSPGTSIAQVEAALAANPAELDRQLNKQPGSVTMPTVHLQQQEDLRPSLEVLGAREIFHDLGKIAVVPAKVASVSQGVDLQIDRNGIRGDSDTVMGIVVLGIMFAPKPFDLRLDRPFIFLIRDQDTGALTYIGAVMDPSER